MDSCTVIQNSPEKTRAQIWPFAFFFNKAGATRVVGRQRTEQSKNNILVEIWSLFLITVPIATPTPNEWMKA